MRKDFQSWHQCKSSIQENEAHLFFHEREIWFCSIGQNIGFEQDGKGVEYLRPVIVLRKCHKQLFVGIPLTRQGKLDHLYYFPFSFREGSRSFAILSQIRAFDVRRLKYCSGIVSKDVFLELKNKIRQLLA